MAVVGWQAPPPQVFPGVDDPATGFSGYVGVRLDATVNLLEAREFAGLDRPTRLRTAVADQYRMLTDLSGAEQTDFDLRFLADPNSATIHTAILARSWSRDPRGAEDAARRAGQHLMASLPGHVTASVLDDPTGWLDPFGPSAALDSVLITRRELVGVPSRPDASTSYYFSVAGFSHADSDWQGFYAARANCRQPCIVSIAAFPFTPPPGYGTELARIATTRDGWPVRTNGVVASTTEPSGCRRTRSPSRRSRLSPAICAAPPLARSGSAFRSAPAPATPGGRSGAGGGDLTGRRHRRCG